MKLIKLNHLIAILGLMLCSFFYIQPVQAESTPNDSNSLQGLSNVKVVFDITQGNPKKLLGRLKLIEKTAAMMIAQGVKPDFVLAFRGPASFYASSDRELISPETHDVADQIAAQISKMDTSKGLEFEQCSVATGHLKIKNESIYPEIRVVGNSWVSLAGYQNKGYAYIPID